MHGHCSLLLCDCTFKSTRMLATLKILFVYITLGSVAGLLGIPYSFLIGDIGPLYRIVMGILRAGLRAGGIHVTVVGLENVPANRSCIFMCNHVSNLDPPVVLPLLPGRSSVLLKKELMKIPLLGTAMRMAKFIPVERSRSREAAQRSVGSAAEALQSGLHILVFPEGTRSLTGRLSTFKKGPFFLARETQAAIVPVAVSGTRGMMRKGSFAIYPGRAQVELLPMMHPADYATREELMTAVHRALADALPEEMKPLPI